MSTVANIVNGEIQKNGVSAAEAKANATSKSSDLDKEAFLQLLELLFCRKNMVSVGREKAREFHTHTLDEFRVVHVEVQGGLDDELEFSGGRGGAGRFGNALDGHRARINSGFPKADEPGISGRAKSEQKKQWKK